MTVPYDYDQDSIDHLREVIAEQERTIEYLHERCKVEEVENHKLRELARLLLYGATHDAEPAEGLVWSQKVNVLVRELGIEVDDG